MLREGTIVLTIQGKVKQKVIKKLTSNYTLQENQGWFFIDYAMEEVPLNARFDVLLEGESKKLIPGSSTIKLLSCLDQFSNRLSYIPEGFKTICRLEFSPKTPAIIKRLPFLDEWDYNPNAISIANHNDIELAVPDVVLKDMYRIVIIQFKNTFNNNKIGKSIFTEKDFVDTVARTFHTEKTSAKRMLSDMLNLGYVTEKDNRELELA